MARRIPLGELCISKVATLPNGFDDIIDYIDISSVDNESKAIVAHQEIEGTEAPSRARQLLEVGDVLVSTVRPNLNAVAFVETAYKYTLVGSTGYCVLRTKEGVDNRFVFYFCQSPCFIEDMTAQATGASYPAVTASIVRNATVPDYSLEKQKEIAQRLDSVTTLLSLRKQQLAKLDELVKSRFIEMFGDPERNPCGWPVKKLDVVVASITAGWSANGEARPKKAGEKAVLKVSAVTQGFFKPDEHKVIPADMEIKKYVYPQKGDLLFSRANTRELVGATAIIEQDYPELLLPDKLWKVLFTNEMDVYYAKHILSTQAIRKVFSSQSTGTSGSMYNVSADKFRETLIPVPPMILQRKFASFVQQTDNSKLAVQQSIDQLETLKKSLMQKYFG